LILEIGSKRFKYDSCVFIIGTQLQDVSATGNQLAVAKADSSPVERFARDTAVQKVAASGNKAIAKATNNKVAGKYNLCN